MVKHTCYKNLLLYKFFRFVIPENLWCSLFLHWRDPDTSLCGIFPSASSVDSIERSDIMSQTSSSWSLSSSRSGLCGEALQGLCSWNLNVSQKKVFLCIYLDNVYTCSKTHAVKLLTFFRFLLNNTIFFLLEEGIVCLQLWLQLIMILPVKSFKENGG